MSVSQKFSATALAVVFLATACRSSSPVAPVGTLTGSWTGQIDDQIAGLGTARFSITQTGIAIAGTWSAAFADSALHRAGTLGGSLTGSAISLFLTPTTPIVCSPVATLSGTLSLTGTATSDHVTGGYVVLTCEGATTGKIDVRRE